MNDQEKEELSKIVEQLHRLIGRSDAAKIQERWRTFWDLRDLNQKKIKKTKTKSAKK